MMTIRPTYNFSVWETMGQIASGCQKRKKKWKHKIFINEASLLVEQMLYFCIFAPG